MDMNKIPAGSNVPEEVNVIVEVPQGAAPVKYEMDKDSGAVFVDRFLQTAMFYPCNYGFLPHTLSLDGDPVDVLVVTPVPLISGSVIRCRPVGMLEMTDEAGEDHKILAVPVSKLTKLYDDVQKPQDLHDDTLNQITHFFEQYKALETGKWVKVENWVGVDRAHEEILSSIERYNNASD